MLLEHHVTLIGVGADRTRALRVDRFPYRSEKAFFDTEIAPRLGPRAEWLGEVSAATKKDLLSRAGCLLFPILWEEPFGMLATSRCTWTSPTTRSWSPDGGASAEVCREPCAPPYC